MKFKINKMQVDTLARSFSSKDPLSFEEVELELVCDTASEAMMQQELKNSYFKQGYQTGYREGYFDGERDRKCGCHHGRCWKCI